MALKCKYRTFVSNLIVFTYLISFVRINEAKIFSKCDFVREAKLFFPEEQIDKWTCIALYESNFNTDAINTNSGDNSSDHGIFQINDRYWCSPGPANVCNVTCEALRSDNLTEAAACAQKIASIQGFIAWSVYPIYCNNSFSFSKDCSGSGNGLSSRTLSFSFAAPPKPRLPDEQPRTLKDTLATTTTTTRSLGVSTARPFVATTTSRKPLATMKTKSLEIIGARSSGITTREPLTTTRRRFLTTIRSISLAITTTRKPLATIKTRHFALTTTRRSFAITTRRPLATIKARSFAKTTRRFSAITTRRPSATVKPRSFAATTRKSTTSRQFLTTSHWTNRRTVPTSFREKYSFENPSTPPYYFYRKTVEPYSYNRNTFH